MERDSLLATRLDDAIRDAIAGDSWGSLPGGMRERIIAALTPDLDYRDVLRQFRARVLASEQRLTRTIPSRRYEAVPPLRGGGRPSRRGCSSRSTSAD